MPEEGDLLLKRTAGGGHPVQPLHGRWVGNAGLVNVDVVPSDYVVAEALCVLRIEQLFHRLLVTPGQTLLELIPGGAESCAAHQMRH